MTDEHYVAMTVECQRCKAKQKIHIAVRPCTGAIVKQTISCIVGKEFRRDGPRQISTWTLSTVTPPRPERVKSRSATQSSRAAPWCTRCDRWQRESKPNPIQIPSPGTSM